MTLSIPLNPVSAVAAPVSAQSPLNQLSETLGGPQTAVQPTRPGSGSQGTASDANTGGQSSREQQAAANARASPTRAALVVPNDAEPRSVVTAQVVSAEKDADNSLANARRSAELNQQIARTKALIDSVSTSPPASSALLERTDTLDRYAPPDPLPTAPILKGNSPTQIKAANA